MRGIKGVNCETTRRMVKTDIGEERWKALIETLTPDLRELATRRIMSVEWIDFDKWMLIEQAFFDQAYHSDYDAYRDLSKRICEHDFGTIYRALLKVGSPAYLVEKSASAYGKIFDFGTLVCTKHEKNPTRSAPVIMRLSGVPNLPPFIAALHGGIEGVLHLSRAKNPDVWVGARSGTDESIVVDYYVTY